MIVNYKDISGELRKIKDKGKYFELYPTGLQATDNIFQGVKGFPLFIGGQVHHGKSEFTLELAVSWAKFQGFKFAVYLGEAGKPEISWIEIAQKYIGKLYFDFSEGDLIEAGQFIEKHFTILHIEDLTVKGFYEEVSNAETEKGFKFDATIFDPFNDAKNGTAEHGGRTDIWLEEDLKLIRKVSAKHNRIDIVVFHVQEIKPIKDVDSGNWFVRNAMPTEWAGGQVVHRRAFTQLLIYRIPEWMKDENGQPYGNNMTMVINQKAKPKGSGKLGKAIIGWDWQRNRYFEEINGTRKYMLDKASSQIAPSKTFEVDFNDIFKDDTAPF